MSQSDYNIENADGATVRADINSQLEAIGSTNSGSTAPSVTFPYMRWHDTANSQLKERNGANTAWIVVADIVSGELVPHAGGAQVPQISGGADANFTAMPQVGGDDLLKERDAIGGAAQSWQDVSGSRSLNTVYTNSTGRPISVMVTVQVNPDASATLEVGGINRARFARTAATTGVDTCPFSVIVPDGVTYEISTSGTVTTVFWQELR